MSAYDQRSTQAPSRKRRIVIPGRAMSVPVAGTPMKSPSCRPVSVKRLQSRSPAPKVSWSSRWFFGNAAKSPS